VRDFATLKTMTTTYPSQSTASYESIKLGIEAHAKYFWVRRQVEPQTMRGEECEETPTHFLNEGG
jgi:hypothetical protein